MKSARFHICDVLHAEAEQRRYWRFSLADGAPALAAEKSFPPNELLPAGWVAKKWNNLWQRKINVAWLPPSQVFLRVIQLPVENEAELPGMVELQLEKLSPLPPAQIVWSFESLPAPDSKLRSVVVVIVARTVVEQFLGQLEQWGYLADRLELPLIHELKSLPADADGLWLIPQTSGASKLCLVAWWTKGVLQNVNLLSVSTSAGWSEVLCQQLTEVAWAGEMEGWLTQVPRCQLVADGPVAAEWEPVLREWSGAPVVVRPGAVAGDLAALSVTRLAQNQSRLNLLPGEYAARYRQQFIDRLWMGSLGALVVVYLLGVVVYFAALQVVKFRKSLVESQITKLDPEYSRVRQLRARVQVLQEQKNLRFAALECWKASCILLPTDLILTDFSLQQGKRLTLHGTAPAANVNQVLSYNDAMGKYRVGGDSNAPTLFKAVDPYSSRSGVGGQTLNWDFSCEINRSEVE